jgi:hypothetical protein
MSKLDKYGTKTMAEQRETAKTAVTNFMGGTSYTLNALDTLRIIAASSIFAEPQYYRAGLEDSGHSEHLSLIANHDIFGGELRSKSAVDVFTQAIDDALSYDFGATLKLAKTLRQDFNMRLNPAVIYVRATLHAGRTAFNEEHAGVMKAVGKEIASRPDDLTNQFDYYMFVNGSKKGLPSLLKRTWAERLQTYSRYQLNKYKGKKLIDLVRLSHANSSDIDELMQTGKLRVTETEMTWERLKSDGKSWEQIIDQIRIPHMALLKNLRGIFTEITERGGKSEGRTLAIKILNDLKAGVPSGKQFPFRYWSAYKAINAVEIDNKQLLLDALEECMDIAVGNTPSLSGKVACLSDNSGSAWGTFNSEYGSVTIAEIANLSSLITAHAAEEGHVGVFGDGLSMKPVSKRNGLLTQLEETSARGRDQGMSTENGIWMFWKEAIADRIHYDTIFIYSDMQAGHGGLYGINPSEYQQHQCERSSRHIDVLSLVQEYRKKVNPVVNIFTVQVGGYNNSILPENLYRGAVLAGWTGRETLFAGAIIDTWNQIESK